MASDWGRDRMRKTRSMHDAALRFLIVRGGDDLGPCGKGYVCKPIRAAHIPNMNIRLLSYFRGLK